MVKHEFDCKLELCAIFPYIVLFPDMICTDDFVTVEKILLEVIELSSERSGLTL